MYTCGPTVYDSAHVGNFRAFLTYDVMKRTLLYLGYENVEHILNLTDIDDKIIQRANELGVSIKELTNKYATLFLNDLQAVNCLPATANPRATDYVAEMMQIIQELHGKGLAYCMKDGSWYFRTQSQEGYGQQLVNLDFDEMQAEDNDEKEHFADFCLWKAYKEGFDRKDGSWSSDDFDQITLDICKGRPGWHLECSAMARAYFGDTTLDLHGGGVDLQFPHHENEIAQSQGVGCNLYCNCWFHNGFVNLDNEKMSKSLGNFLTLQTACPTALDVRAYRYLVVTSQYRNALAFTPQALGAAKSAVQRIDKVWNAVQELETEEGDSELCTKTVPDCLANFNAALKDDLSMPRAAASLFNLVKAAEKELRKEEDQDTAGLVAIRKALAQMDRVMGVFYQVPSTHCKEEEEKDVEIPNEVLDLVSRRTSAKEAKDWDLADSLRQRITELGYAVKDVKGGDPIITTLES